MTSSKSTTTLELGRRGDSVAVRITRDRQESSDFPDAARSTPRLALLGKWGEWVVRIALGLSLLLASLALVFHLVGTYAPLELAVAPLRRALGMDVAVAIPVGALITPATLWLFLRAGRKRSPRR